MRQNGQRVDHSENEEKSEMKITRAGVDIAKSVFHVHGVDCQDKPVSQIKLKRGQLLDALWTRLVPGAEVGMEAASAADSRGASIQPTT